MHFKIKKEFFILNFVFIALFILFYCYSLEWGEKRLFLNDSIFFFYIVFCSYLVYKCDFNNYKIFFLMMLIIFITYFISSIENNFLDFSDMYSKNLILRTIENRINETVKSGGFLLGPTGKNIYLQQFGLQSRILKILNINKIEYFNVYYKFFEILNFIIISFSLSIFLLKIKKIFSQKVFALTFFSILVCFPLIKFSSNLYWVLGIRILPIALFFYFYKDFFEKKCIKILIIFSMLLSLFSGYEYVSNFYLTFIFIILFYDYDNTKKEIKNKIFKITILFGLIFFSAILFHHFIGFLTKMNTFEFFKNSVIYRIFPDSNVELKKIAPFYFNFLIQTINQEILFVGRYLKVNLIVVILVIFFITLNKGTKKQKKLVITSFVFSLSWMLVKGHALHTTQNIMIFIFPFFLFAIPIFLDILFENEEIKQIKFPFIYLFILNFIFALFIIFTYLKEDLKFLKTKNNIFVKEETNYMISNSNEFVDVENFYISNNKMFLILKVKKKIPEKYDTLFIHAHPFSKDLSKSPFHDELKNNGFENWDIPFGIPEQFNARELSTLNINDKIFVEKNLYEDYLENYQFIFLGLYNRNNLEYIDPFFIEIKYK